MVRARNVVSVMRVSWNYFWKLRRTISMLILQLAYPPSYESAELAIPLTKQLSSRGAAAFKGCNLMPRMEYPLAP